MASKTRKFYPQSLSTLIPKMVKPALRKSKNPVAGLVARWEEIAGAEFAQLTWPQKVTYPKQSLNGGTLHLEVDPSLALELQHMQPVFLERINTYYGYQAIKSLKIVQRHMAERLGLNAKTQPKTRPLTQDETTRLDQIEDEGLRTVLKRLGTYVTD